MQQRTMADFICIALIIIVYDGEKTLLLAVLVPDFLSHTFYHRKSLRYKGRGSGGDLPRLSKSQRALR